MGDRGRGRIPFVAVDHRLDAVRREHLERGREGLVRQRVRVLADEKRTRDALAAAVAADGLRDRQDVRFVERATE